MSTIFKKYWRLVIIPNTIKRIERFLYYLKGVYRMRKIILTLICCILLLSLLPNGNDSITYANTQTNDDFIVNASILNLREGPGLTYPIVKELKKNDPLTKLEQRGDWVKVSSSNITGWVAAWLIKSSNTEIAVSKHVVTQVDHLNIRKEPSTSASVLSQLFTGQKATYIMESGDWVQVEYNKITGWVNKKYISIIEQDAENKNDLSPSEKKSEELNYFTVTVSAVNIRKKPDLSSKKLGTIKEGEQYEIINREGNWIEIEYAKNKKGWVYSFYGTFSTSKVENSESDSNNKEKQYAQIIYDGTNLREQPNTKSAVVKRANVGESYEITANSNDWFEIKVDDKKAYIANWVVKLKQSQTSSEESTATKPARKKGTLNGITIVIDPGHGGNDHGTTGVNKTPEKVINLLTAELLTSKLRSAGAEVVLTRESDKYVDLRKRVAVSSQNNADAFISIHYDAHELSSVNGFTTYYTNSNQKALAQAIHKGLSGKLSLRDRGVQPGNYLVLRENSKPAVLLELGYLSNRDEERTVTTDFFREQATQGIYNGLIAYFDAQLK